MNAFPAQAIKGLWAMFENERERMNDKIQARSAENSLTPELIKAGEMVEREYREKMKYLNDLYIYVQAMDTERAIHREEERRYESADSWGYSVKRERYENPERLRQKSIMRARELYNF